MDFFLFGLPIKSIINPYMKTPDIKTANNNRYEIQGDKIIDTEKEIKNGEPIYIREVLDSGSQEFKSSAISKKDRLDIVGSLGLNALIPVLDECFKNGNKGYNVLNEIEWALYDLLNGAYPALSFILVENDSKTKRSVQLVIPSCK